MRELFDSTVRKTMNAVFDAGVSGVASIGFVIAAVILYFFNVI